MNKIKAAGIILLLAVIFTASAYAGIDVPEAVKKKVTGLFPNAGEIEWQKDRKGNYAAVFAVNERSVEIILDEKGNVLELQKEVDRAELPAAIATELEKRKLARVARAVYMKKGNSEVYLIVGLTEDKRLRMSYDASGKLVSETVIDRKKKQQATVTASPAGLVSYKKKWELPLVLREISGIALIDQNRIACVQDEAGTIFIYDLAGSKIISDIPFGEPGDHEGIALVKNDAWVLRSDGKLYQVKDFLSSKPQVHEHILQFGHEQNLEGLCYDKKNNRLLIAPREFDTESDTHKGIYSFDLSSHTFSNKQVFTISMDDPLLAEIDPRPGRSALMPSAIGIHPVTGNIYITDARNSQVLIADSKGKPLKLIPLNSSIHPKTEGIAFTPSGEIYLSNEGKKQSPNLVLLSRETLD